MRAKSVDELRASNRARQKRWREKHLGYAKLKEKNAWEKRKAEGHSRDVIPNKALGTPNVIPVTGELHYGPVAGVDKAYEDKRVYQNWKPANEPRIVRAIKEGPIEISEQEAERTRATLARLQELKERQAAGGLDAGVEVELEL